MRMIGRLRLFFPTDVGICSVALYGSSIALRSIVFAFIL